MLGRAADADRARHLLGDVVRALQLQELARPPQDAADDRPARAAGPGRERRRRRHRRRPRRRLQDRIAQPPVVHRAVPGRRHRRRRHHPRHLHHGRAADRAAQLAALRSARQPARAPQHGGRGGRHRRLRQLHRHSHRRRRDRVRRELHRQSARQRLLPRHLAGPTRSSRASASGVGNAVFYVGVEDRPRRHSRRHDGVGRVRREVGREAPGGAGGRSVHGEAAPRGLPGGDEDRRARRHPGHGRGRPHLLDLRDGRARRRRRRDRRVARAAARDRHDAVRDHALASRRSACCSWPSRGARRKSSAIFEKWDLHAVPHRRRHRRRPAAREGARRRWWPRFPTPRSPTRRRSTGARTASRRTCSEAQQLSLGGARARRRRAAEVLRRLLASPTVASKRWVYRQYDHMVRTNTAGDAGHGRRRGSRQGHDARAGALGRLQRPVRLPRSVRRRAAGGGRGVAQRGVRRRAADRRHELPQLRQPGEARHHVAVRPRRSRAWAPPAARSTSRSPAATSASTTRPTAAACCRRRCSASSA